MESFIIDTNFFFNLEIKSGFGKNPNEIIVNLTDMAKKLKKEKKAELFMPASIVSEFKTFMDEKSEIANEFLTTITIKSPDIENIKFSVAVFYKLVDESRSRSYRGLQIAEEIADQAGKIMLGKQDLSKVDYQKTIGVVVNKLRERYRQATRFNFLDSVADLDLIVLAKELDGCLVTSDEGVTRWGRIFGVKEISSVLFRQRLVSLLE
ncbi:RNA ligase partner protein [Candidatus Roizmanbacteria bacterium RIFCSPHIGHO2_02_FULL_37_13b]|uniref:RNA ligase partner protein n=1 Tax=Candidatus Roizmanbacteria bacterium RIFCSPLOWO2_02_FULL_36_11 TaxID=1802071 RepID=A0A1F7JH46_9BACT|nr:MAG: RNA ligase partner protein [Candidatus Roizmanbacteria bacterium RIFCSPHIGHO2_02_FULL_37_13b]OGK54934.1 MAG: RNA ligase partner protein [Candidatus Roizmanbacteria bacterium RIFCSPLOWO2_02_FULL_36_11]